MTKMPTSLFAMKLSASAYFMVYLSSFQRTYPKEDIAIDVTPLQRGRLYMNVPMPVNYYFPKKKSPSDKSERPS